MEQSTNLAQAIDFLITYQCHVMTYIADLEEIDRFYEALKAKPYSAEQESKVQELQNEANHTFEKLKNRLCHFMTTSPKGIRLAYL